MKKIVEYLLVTVLACATLSGCGQSKLNGQGAQTYNITVQGAVFGGTDGDEINTEVSFDPGWLTRKSNTKYNKDLAAFSAIICDEVYFRSKDLEAGRQNRVLFECEKPEDYDVTAFLKKVGFSEAEYIESYKVKEYSGDGNDSVTMLLAHGVADDKYDIYAAVIRGCFSMPERLSVYDPGCEGEKYTELTGQHPEWTDLQNFKGCDVAMNRAMEFIDEFIEQNDNPDYENRILITGHSRGGSLAGMIGARMEDRENIVSYTYTFNAPLITDNEKAQDYKTVFNVFDSNDYFVNPMPFGEEKLFRYGRNMTLSINDSNEIKTALAEIKGQDDFAALDKETKDEFEKIFGQRFKNRESLYDMKTVTQSFETEEEALNRIEECRMLIGSESGLGLETLCSVDDAVSEEGDKYTVSLNYCDGAIMQALAELTGYGAPAYEAAVKLFEEDKEACEVLRIIMENSGEVAGGHRLFNSFVLTGYVK